MSKSIAEQLAPVKRQRHKSINEQYKGESDGVEHINICFTGKTELGRMLSLEFEQKFVHPILGPFKSLTNYWAYLKSESRNTSLRFMKPSTCLPALKRNNDMRDSVENFKALIVRGCYYKIMSTPKLKDMVMKSTLPFQMYFIKIEKETTGATEVKYEVKVPHKYSYWLIGGYEEVRRAIKNKCDLDISSFLSNPNVPLYQDFAMSVPESELPNIAGNIASTELAGLEEEHLDDDSLGNS